MQIFETSYLSQQQLSQIPEIVCLFDCLFVSLRFPRELLNDMTLHILLPDHYRIVLKYSPPPPQNTNFGICLCAEVEPSLMSRLPLENLSSFLFQSNNGRLGSRDRFTGNNGRWFKTVSSQEEGTYEDESYQIGEHIAANFSDCSMLVKSSKKPTIVHIESLTCLRRLSQQQTIRTQEKILVLAVKKDIFDTNMSCILNLRPVISIATPPSTKRFYIFACYNAELLEIIANSVSDVMRLFM